MALFRKITGLLLIIASILGLVISIAGIGTLWRIEPNISAGLHSSVDLFVNTLETTTQGLTVTQGALKASVQTISSLADTVQTIGVTVQTSTPMVDQITVMMDEDLPNAINATVDSLNTAAKSAAVIDTLLGTLSGIPLIGSTLSYDPATPLSVSLGEVADGLESLPASISKMHTSLQDTATSLETFQSDLSATSHSIREIETSVASYDSVIQGYQTSITQLKTGMGAVQTNLPNYVHLAVLALTAFLVWLAIAQLGLMTQGWELLTETPQKKEVEKVKEAVEAAKEG